MNVDPLTELVAMGVGTKRFMCDPDRRHRAFLRRDGIRRCAVTTSTSTRGGGHWPAGSAPLPRWTHSAERKEAYPFQVRATWFKGPSGPRMDQALLVLLI